MDEYAQGFSDGYAQCREDVRRELILLRDPATYAGSHTTNRAIDKAVVAIRSLNPRVPECVPTGLHYRGG